MNNETLDLTYKALQDVNQFMKVLDDYKLVQTCGACPEQYDMFYNGKLIGYLRLRNGNFTVRYYGNDIEGELVYQATLDHDYGAFEYEEREEYLTKAKLAIYMKHLFNGLTS